MLSGCSGARPVELDPKSGWFAKKLTRAERLAKIAAYHKLDGKNFSKLLALGKNPTVSADPKKIKTDYEAILEREQKGAPLKYNVEATALGDVLGKGKLQCSSGTLMYSLLLAEKGAEDDAVVIVEDGHVLPGFVEKVPAKDGKPESYRLFGVETTYAGKAIKSYGDLGELSQGKYPLRVVTMSDYLAIEANKDDIAKYQVGSIRKAAQARFDEKYGLAPKARWKETDQEAKPSCKDLNWSPLAFGAVDVPPGDRDRKTADELQAPFGSIPLGYGFPQFEGLHVMAVDFYAVYYVSDKALGHLEAAQHCYKMGMRLANYSVVLYLSSQGYFEDSEDSFWIDPTPSMGDYSATFDAKTKKIDSSVSKENYKKLDPFNWRYIGAGEKRLAICYMGYPWEGNPLHPGASYQQTQSYSGKGANVEKKKK